MTPPRRKRPPSLSANARPADGRHRQGWIYQEIDSMSHEDRILFLRLSIQHLFTVVCAFTSGAFLGFHIGWLRGVDDEVKERNRQGT
jgi:hypothetical protein